MCINRLLDCLPFCVSCKRPCMTLPQGWQLAGGRKGQAILVSQAHCTPLPHTAAALNKHHHELEREVKSSAAVLNILQMQAARYMLKESCRNPLPMGLLVSYKPFLFLAM